MNRKHDETLLEWVWRWLDGRKGLTLLMVIMTAAAAHAQTNAYAYGYFTGPDGNVALVNIVRTQDATTHVITTELFYTFCGQANTGTACQRGDGIIPNTALTGTVLYDRTKPDVMRVVVDTSAVAGYHNQLCTGGVGDFGDCIGDTPATGGLVSVMWTRTQEWANLSTSSFSNYQQNKLTSSGNSKLGVFSAKQTGTVLGVAATAGAVMTTATDAQTVLEKFQARKAIIKGVK